MQEDPLCLGVQIMSAYAAPLTRMVAVATLGMMLVMLPMFFLGMYEKDGQPLEKIAQHFIQAKIIRPQVRPYQTNNYYAALIRQDELEQEVQRIVH